MPSSSSQHWPAREDQDTNTEAEAATFEDKEVNAEPAISHNTVGTEDNNLAGAGAGDEPPEAAGADEDIT